MKEKEPHAGKMVKAELKRQWRTITWLAKQFVGTRENMYKVLNKSWIKSESLVKSV
jgi:lambda repressor-like predicted transcriptional regulator